MSHDLETRNGKVSFAYNIENGTPWHLLGTPFDGKQPLQIMLKEVGADFEAYAAPACAEIAVIDLDAEDGVDAQLIHPVSRKHMAICANRPIGANDEEIVQIFAFMGSGYKIVQYERVAERAANVVGESKDSAVFDAMGLLYEGNQFFATLDLGELIIDPRGIHDVIERYLIIRSSHDGSYAVTYVPSDIRAVCRNTCDFAIQGATRSLKARHTANVDQKLEVEEAQRVLGFSTAWADAYKKAAEQLLAVPFTPVLWDRVVNTIFPIPEGATARKENNVIRKRESVRGIFEGDNNAGNFGKSGWTMFNAVVEYLDHGRPGKPENRALASMTPGTTVDQTKTRTAKMLLASRN